MRRRHASALTAALLAVALVAAGAGAAAGVAPESGSPDAVVVSLDRARMSTGLGDGFALGSTITNTGRRPLSGLIAHLNVVSLTNGVYVDPEDWSPQRTKNVPTLAPGRSARIAWRVNAVNGGHFAVYVVAVPRTAPRTARTGLAIGTPLSLRVVERRVFDSGGVLFVALGVPVLLALALAATRLRRRRAQA
jgi:hypothetical protein